MDDLRRIDLNLLLALDALLQERHVTRAALRLHRSQPAVSHALAQLRQLFNDPLLVRGESGFTLSARAQELVQPLQDALEQLRGLLSAPVFDPSRAKRRFRLAMSDYGARVVLPDLLQRLRVQAPHIDLAITQGSRETMLTQLLDGETDLALGVFPDLPDGLQTQTLFEETYACLADRSTLGQGNALTFDQWLARPHVQVAMHPQASNQIDLALGALGLKRRVALVLPHWSAAAEVITGTDLILTVARRSLGVAQRNQALCVFEPPLIVAPFDFQQVWHARREVDPGHRWLRGLLCEILRQD